MYKQLQINSFKLFYKVAYVQQTYKTFDANFFLSNVPNPSLQTILCLQRLIIKNCILPRLLKFETSRQSFFEDVQTQTHKQNHHITVLVGNAQFHVSVGFAKQNCPNYYDLLKVQQKLPTLSKP